MKKRKSFALIGICLFILGFLFLINSKFNLTGAIISEQISSLTGSAIGLVLIIGGVLLFFIEANLEQRANAGDYYRKRALEIFDPKFKGQDVWVSRWELGGLMNYLKQNTEISTFEHGSNIPTIHLYPRDAAGKTKREMIEKGELGIESTDPTGILHMNVFAKMEDDYGRAHKIKRHFFITNDSYDPRLESVGRDIQTGKKVKSKIYNPHPPYVEEQAYKRGIFLGRTDYRENKRK